MVGVGCGVSTNDSHEDAREEPTTSETDDGVFDDRIADYPWLLGILTGTWTFVVGLAVMAVVVLAATDDPTVILDQPSAVFTDVGITFYNAHNVVADVRVVESIANPDAVPASLDFLSGPTSIPKAVYYATPVVVLLAVGALLAGRTLPRDASLQEAVLPAGALSVGYTLFAVLGTFVVRGERAEGVVLVVPNLSQAFVYGLLYSLGCGLVAGLAVLGWRNREAIQDGSAAE